MALLELTAVTMRFGGVTALDAVTLALPEGGITGLIGPNGSGKSTLVNVATGFVRPSGGRILFDGRDVTGTAPDVSSRAGLMRTFQKLNLFLRMTALENVMVPLLVRCVGRQRATAIADECLAMVGLSTKRDSLGRTLSTGQRKRLELARVIAARPRLVFLDEVMAGIDAPSVPALMKVIRDLGARGITIVVIEHNMNVIRELTSRTIVLHLGRVVDDGPPETVLARGEVMKAYLGEDGERAPGG